jgi:metal-responsive CopG/Arc/MetJ family transcriptional regulator
LGGSSSYILGIVLVVRVSLELDEKLLREVERLVRVGYMKAKREAFERALQLLVRSYKALGLAERIDRVREGTEVMLSVTEALAESHEEEG